MAGTAPVGDALIDALEDVLERHPARADVPDLSYFDGALTALLLLPKGMPCAELVSNIHADIGQGFADPDDDARFIELLALRQAEIVAGLLEGGQAFTPLYLVDDAGNPVWELWLAGFLGGLKLRQERFEELLAMDDEDAETCMLGLLSLAATLPGMAEALAVADLSAEGPDLLGGSDLHELAEDAPDMIPYFVETIYRRRHGLERVVMGDDDYAGPAALPVRSPKIGRNDPCPCGSGKKYKKCCLA